MNDMSLIHNTPEGVTKAEKVITLMRAMLKYKLDIEAALNYSNNSHSFDNIVDMVVTGTVHFYELKNSYILMEIQTFPNHKVYHVFLAGGEKEELLDVHPWMLENAKTLGCKFVSICGRLGWVKELKQHGWTYQYAILSKEVP